jgi:hypothetical protein
VQATFQFLLSTISDLGAIETTENNNLASSSLKSTLWKDDANRQQLYEEFVKFIGTLSNTPHMDHLIVVVDGFQRAYENDWVFRNYFSDLKQFLSKSLAQSNYIDSADWLPKGVSLLQRGRLMFGKRLPSLTDQLCFHFFGIVDGIQTNPLLDQLSKSMSNVSSCIFLNDAKYDYSMREPILYDFRYYVLPMLIQNIKLIPLPRMEYSDSKYDLSIDNMVFILQDIFPNMIELKFENQVQISPLPDFPDIYRMDIATIDIVQVQAEMKNIEFSYVKKSFPKMRDSGLADLLVSGNGISVHVKVAKDPNLWYTTLIPLEIDCAIDNFELKMHDSGKQGFYRLFGKSIVSSIKSRICKAVEESIFKLISRMDGVATGMKNPPKNSQEKIPV